MRGLGTLGAALIALLVCASLASARPAIVGGQDAPPGSWPSAVFLYGTYGAQPYGCTGSVVAPEWVVTAAHCAYGAPGHFADTMTAVLGVKDYTDASRQAIAVDRLVVHPQYDAGRDTDDVALFHLSTPTTAPAIRLATKAELASFVSFTGVPNAAGWGTTDQQSTMLTTKLQQAYLQVRRGDECAQLIPGFDRATQVCAGTQNTSGACHGDSGGPLVAFDSTTREPVLWGLTSYGPQAAQHLAPCSTALPVVYSWVPAFADFIQATIATTAPPPATAPAAPPVPSGPVPPAPITPSAACLTARAKVTTARKAETTAYKKLRKLRARHASGKKVAAASKRYHALRTKRIRASVLAGKVC
jgi:secreted trypsin-like serine protease